MHRSRPRLRRGGGRASCKNRTQEDPDGDLTDLGGHVSHPRPVGAKASNRVQWPESTTQKRALRTLGNRTSDADISDKGMNSLDDIEAPYAHTPVRKEKSGGFSMRTPMPANEDSRLESL